mgnify:CR=1 FL=1
MELKDVILSTLAEIEELTISPELPEEVESPGEEEFISRKSPRTETLSSHQSGHEEEMRMLEGIRERLLVLFEGFQSPNNIQIEAKVDLTLNFLEYLLATIDNRLDTIKQP